MLVHHTLTLYFLSNLVPPLLIPLTVSLTDPRFTKANELLISKTTKVLHLYIRDIYFHPVVLSFISGILKKLMLRGISLPADIILGLYSLIWNQK